MNDAQHKILLLSINDALNPLCYLIIHTHTTKKRNKDSTNLSIILIQLQKSDRACGVIWRYEKKIVSKGVKKEIGMGPYTYLFARLSYSYIVKQQAEWKYATATCWCAVTHEKKSNTPKLQKKEIDSELNIMISRFNGHFTNGWVWANLTVWLGEIHMLQRETLSILAYFVKC